MHEVRAKPLDHMLRSAGLETGEACERTSHPSQLQVCSTCYGSGTAAPSGSHLPWEGYPLKRNPVVEAPCPGPSNTGEGGGAGNRFYTGLHPSPGLHRTLLHCLGVWRAGGVGWGQLTELLATSPARSKIFILTILALNLQPNTIHIPNIAITSCPLGDNPQFLNVQRNLCLCTLFQRNLQNHESSKPKQTTTLDLNHMPLLLLWWAKRGLPRLIRHLKRPPVTGVGGNQYVTPRSV